MTLTVLKARPSPPTAVAVRPTSQTEAAKVVTLAPQKTVLKDKIASGAQEVLAVLLPPLIVIAVLLLIWEVAASGPKSSLPSPSRIWTEARDLITDPFFVNGSQDIGLGWRVLTSLQRVAIGFGR